MFVKVGNSFSGRRQCTSGVPQGGVLSPILFMVYTCDLPDRLKTHAAISVQMFADDIKVYGTYNASNQSLVLKALNQSILNMITWASNWEIPVNLAKTSVMHFGPGRAPDYRFGNITLRHVDAIKDLGIHMNKHLKFDAHVDLTVRKALSVLYGMLRSIFDNDSATLLKLYKAYVLPILEYGSQIWSPQTKKLQNKVEKVQQTFTRILVRRCMPDLQSLNYESRLKFLKLKSLRYRRIYNDLVFCFKLLKGDLTLRASKYWTFRPCRNRTSILSLQFKNPGNKFLRCNANFVLSRGAVWLQKLPDHVLEAPTVAIFKSRLKKIDLLSSLELQS